MQEGYEWRKESQENIFAYFTCWLINTQLTKPITSVELLKPLRGEDGEEKKRTKVDELQEKFKGVLG